MKKQQIWCWLGTSALLMLLIPGLSRIFIHSHWLTGIAMLLMLLIYPIDFLILGIFAGLNAEKRWWLPFPTAVLFLIGMRVSFQWWFSASLGFALPYLALAMVVMLITMLIRDRKVQKT